MLSINLRHVGYENESDVLRDININIDRGEKLVILGESGSGKSTLIKTVCGINTVFDGELTLYGIPLENTKARMGYMPQKSSLLPWFTVFENIISLKKARDKHASTEKAEALMKDLKILHLKNKYPKEISGGEQQRAVLAEIIMFEPEIILMDEPFSALDEVTRENIQTLFCSLQKDYNFTTLFVTHSVEEALLIADKIVVLSKKTQTICRTLETSHLKPWSSEFYKHANSLREVIKNVQS